MANLSLINAALRTATLAYYELTKKDDSLPDFAWQLTQGVVILPEVRCPWCKEGVMLRMIYILRQDVLTKAYYARGSRTEGRTCTLHPHVSSAGIVCFGSATSALAALSLLKPSDAYWTTYDIAAWLYHTGKHTCPGTLVQIGRNDDGPQQ